MNLQRRTFLKQTAAIGIGAFVANSARILVGDETSANEKLNIASIGVGGKGGSDCSHAGALGNMVAICDIDENTLNSKGNEFKDARKYFDFRAMLTEMGDKIDAVTVSTPDHTHATAAAMAMNMGKHVYCQKPLAWSVHECRVLRTLAKEKKVSTQMGNQGSAESGLRRAVEIIQAGVIGNVTEIHVWTNRPVWPQAPKVVSRPVKSVEVPKHVHWNEWLGPAPERPYGGDRVYHSFNWRGWWDFGTGALGDMACHTANMAFRAAKLGLPTRISAESGVVNPETFPAWARITYEFPSREGLPPVKLMWYEGKKDGQLVLPDPKLLYGQTPPGSGLLLVGEKGTLYSPNDYGASYKLYPEENYRDYKGPEETIARKDGRGTDEWMKFEWLRGAKGGPAPYSNFEIAGALTESMILGNIAVRTSRSLDYDAEKMAFTNQPEADQFLSRPYREGWALAGEELLKRS